MERSIEPVIEDELTQDPTQYLTQETQIIDHIEIVTIGIIKDLEITNSYASWKNTAKGLKLIKNNKRDFYLGIKLWLNITLSQLIGTDKDNILQIMASTCPWIHSLIEIKKIINERSEP